MVTFRLAVKLKKPLRKAAVFTASQLISAVDGLKVAAYGLKEEIEDVVAEAVYENMKKHSEKNELEKEHENSED